MHKDGGFSLEKDWQHSSEAKLDHWFNGQGDLLAIRTGLSYDVFDFDAQNHGLLSEFLARIERHHQIGKRGHITVQGVVATPSGGYHLYVRALNRRKRPIARGVDYQGNLGIAFIPPSRKRSKVTGKVAPYRWLEWSPSGDDDGEAIYDTLANWDDHPPIPALTHAKADGHHGLTRGDVRRYRREGIPDSENHDDTLRDIVWSLCMWSSSEEYARQAWLEVTEKTPPKAGRRPYEERDFLRHWNGAERKLRGAP